MQARKRTTTSLWPFASATSAGVLPSRSLASVEAPTALSSSTIWLRPISAARCRAVPPSGGSKGPGTLPFGGPSQRNPSPAPFSLAVSTAARRLKSISTTTPRSSLTASCSGVWPRLEPPVLGLRALGVPHFDVLHVLTEEVPRGAEEALLRSIQDAFASRAKEGPNSVALRTPQSATSLASASASQLVQKSTPSLRLRAQQRLDVLVLGNAQRRGTSAPSDQP